MIGSIITGFKVLAGAFSLYKWAIASVAILTFATTVFVYIGNHSEMKATVASQEVRIDALIESNFSLETVVAARNATIARQNLSIRQAIKANEARIAEANRAVEALRVERDIITEELSITRFETLEAIRDDEDFADWVDRPVPIVGWSLLRASEGE